MKKCLYAVMISLAVCNAEAELDVRPLRMAVEDLAKSYPDRYPGADYLKQLDKWEQKLADIRVGVRA